MKDTYACVRQRWWFFQYTIYSIGRIPILLFSEENYDTVIICLFDGLKIVLFFRFF